MYDQEQATKVVAVIAEHLCVPEAQPSDSMLDDLGADSLDAVEITMALEAEFGIGISDDEAGKCSLVSDWIDLVRGKTA